MTISINAHSIPCYSEPNVNTTWSNSARSRVRGTLEVYHAFIRDLDASDTSSTTNLEQDWEIVQDGDSEHDVEPEAQAQVNTRDAYIQFDKSEHKMHTHLPL